MTIDTREPQTDPHGLPVVRPAREVEVAAPGGLRAALVCLAVALTLTWIGAPVR